MSLLHPFLLLTPLTLHRQLCLPASAGALHCFARQTQLPDNPTAYIEMIEGFAVGVQMYASTHRYAQMSALHALNEMCSVKHIYTYVHTTNIEIYIFLYFSNKTCVCLIKSKQFKDFTHTNTHIHIY